MNRLAPSLAPLLVVALALVALPEAAAACSVCNGGAEESRQAFLFTTVLLSLLPIGMICGLAWWIWRHFREEEAAGDPRVSPPIR